MTPKVRASCLLALVGLLAGERARADSGRVAKGRELYEQGCQSCHGSDGRGNPQWESPVRPIEFTDCGTTSEATETWATIVKKGGPARGLDSAMPAFGPTATMRSARSSRSSVPSVRAPSAIRPET